MGNQNQYSASSSTGERNLIPSSKKLKDASKMTIILESPIDTHSESQIDMLKRSLEGVLQQLQKIEQSNNDQGKELQKLIKNNREEMKQAFKLHNRETRRRLEMLEKKTYSGFFN